MEHGPIFGTEFSYDRSPCLTKIPNVYIIHSSSRLHLCIGGGARWPSFGDGNMGVYKDNIMFTDMMVVMIDTPCYKASPAGILTWEFPACSYTSSNKVRD